MVINVPVLLFALLLLWLPRQWMRLGFSLGSRRTKRSAPGGGRGQEPWKTREPGDVTVSIRDEFRKLRNYFDLLRGAAGSVAVMGGLDVDACLGVAANAPHTVELEVLVVKLLILLVGLLIQTLRFEKQRLVCFAPIFFLCGITIGLCGLKPALFAFALIWAVNPMVGGPQSFLFVYALLIFAFGRLFGELSSLLTVVAFIFCFLPVLVSLLSQRPLVLFTRKSVRAQGVS
jgi:hypothetical protein